MQANAAILQEGPRTSSSQGACAHSPHPDIGEKARHLRARKQVECKARHQGAPCTPIHQRCLAGRDAGDGAVKGQGAVACIWGVRGALRHARG